MKKNTLLTCFLLVSVFYLAILPVTAQAAAQAGSAVLPIFDPGNDVYHSDDPMKPLSGPQVTTKPQIDILAASLHPTNGDLCIEFNASPINNYPYYTYTVTIGNEYMITNIYGGGSYQLIKLIGISEKEYWDPVASEWSSTPKTMYYSFSGKNVTYEDVKTAIPNIASLKVTIMGIYVQSSTSIYTDVAPLKGGIPSFPLLLVAISILTAMGLILILRKSTIIKLAK